MVKKTILSSLITVGAILLTSSSVQAESFLVLTSGSAKSLTKKIEKAGATVDQIVEEAGMLIVEATDDSFSSALPSGVTVVPNIDLEGAKPLDLVEFDGSHPTSPTNDDRYYDLQWGLDAVNAPEAWADGVKGDGVLVAVLDGGFSLGHPDIASQIVGAIDFTGEGVAYGPNADDPSGIYSHGMHVAGTIAAADNGFGIIGVAPEAKLLLVKVLRNEGSGSFGAIISGIIFAANYPGVDIINMSLGADIPQGYGLGANQVAALRTATSKAVSYAYQKGITVIVAAGNDGRDLNADQSMKVIPADSPHAISISATGPEGWAADPETSLDTPAIYTNYGTSGIDFAAPGGDYEVAYTDPATAFSVCNVAGIINYCYVFDYVFSTGASVGSSNYFYWSVGTSMAAPHASGVAALIISENGGSMHPAQVKSELAKRAADLGKPGNDAYYGAGRLSSGF